MDDTSFVVAAGASSRPSSIEKLVSAVYKHGKTPGADYLFGAFVVTRQVYSLFIVGTANKTLQGFRGHVNPPVR
jgi:hypothetical protein